MQRRLIPRMVWAGLSFAKRRLGVSMIIKRGVIFALVALGAGGALLWLRHGFEATLTDIDTALRQSRVQSGPRTDLPPEVVALAARVGAMAEAGGFATFDQSGQMWSKPGAKPMAFTAHQTVRADAAGFLWRAKFQRPVPMVVADYFQDGTGALEVRVLGAVQVTRGAGPAFDQGEAVRYLAEIPLNPDAILCNRTLEWTVIDARTISVAMGVGAARGAVTFDLDDNGLITGMFTPSRMSMEGNVAVARPWRGRFWDYQQMGGRLLPLQAEVGWVRDGGDFIYWRGIMLNWRAGAVADVPKSVND